MKRRASSSGRTGEISIPLKATKRKKSVYKSVSKPKMKWKPWKPPVVPQDPAYLPSGFPLLVEMGEKQTLIIKRGTTAIRVFTHQEVTFLMHCLEHMKPKLPGS